MLQRTLGVPKGICRRDGKYLAACHNIFVWNKKVGDFVSLFDAAMGEPILDEFGRVNRTLQVVVYNKHPFIVYKSHSRQFEGYFGDIWTIIQETSDLNINISCIKSFGDGEKVIEAGKADLFLTGAVAESNTTNIYYPQPYLMNWYHLYLKTPEVKGSANSYLRTFSVPLWCATGGVFAILSLSLFMTSKVLNTWRNVEPSRISLPSCFLGVVSGFINQGFNLKLKSISGRMQVFFALLLGVVLYSSMNAVLFSRLAVIHLEFPFKFLEDIPKRKTISLCLRNESFVYYSFRDGSKEILPQWQGIVNNENCLDITDQSNIDKIICKDNIVVFENRVIMSAVWKRTKFLCDVISFDKIYFMNGNTFLMAKSLKERRLIEHIMTKLRSAGIFDRLERVWIKSYDSKINVESWNVVSMQHVCGILSAYATMLLLSLIILAMETLWKKYIEGDDMTSVVAIQWIE